MNRIQVTPILNSSNVVAIPVVSTGNVYTRSQSMAYGRQFALWYKATVDSGTPDVDLYLQQSFGVPTTEGAVGDATDGWITVGSKLADIGDENWHGISISALSMPFLRFLLDGQGANPATCTVKLNLGMLENL